MTITLTKKRPPVSRTHMPFCTIFPQHERDARILAEIDKLCKATNQSRRAVVLTILDAALKDVKVNGYSHE